MISHDKQVKATTEGDHNPAILHDLKAAVEEKLSESSHAEMRRIIVRMDPEGVVTLQGRVRSYYLRQVAYQLAYSVDEARKIRDEIKVRNVG